MDPTPLTGHAEALERARGLAAAHDWVALAALAPGLDARALDEAPELGYLCADALNRTGSAGAAAALAARVEPALRRAGDRRMLLRLGNLLGVIAFEDGRMEAALAAFSDLLEDAVTWGDDEFAARAANNLGVLANIRGERELALACYERSLAAYQRMGHLRGLAQTHHNLGISWRDLGRADHADAHYRRAIEFGRRSGSEDVVGLAETERASLRIASGDAALAERWLRDAARRFEKLGDVVRRGEVLRVQASAAVLRGQPAAAGELLDEALAIARTHGNLLLRAEVQRDRARLLQGREARAAWLEAAGCFEKLGDAAEAATAREAAGGSVP